MRSIKILFVLCFCTTAWTVSGQSNEELSQTYSKRYDIVASKLGADGVGIETILNDWEKVDSANVKMLTAKFNYYFTKAQSKSVVVKDTRKYLGMEPVLQLKDSTGRDVYYFQETFYEDSLFAKALKTLDKALEFYPQRLDIHFLKTAALISYEKDSPDMALAELLDLVDMDVAGTMTWEYPDIEADTDFFNAAMQEYCYTFYNMGSMSSYEAFRVLSERMLKSYPKNTMFMSNLGTYYFVVVKDNKKALKFYDKVLKIKPDDYTAIKNSILLARKTKNVKLEKKYLPLLAKYGTENERAAAEARLKSL